MTGTLNHVERALEGAGRSSPHLLSCLSMQTGNGASMFLALISHCKFNLSVALDQSEFGATCPLLTEVELRQIG